MCRETGKKQRLKLAVLLSFFSHVGSNYGSFPILH